MKRKLSVYIICSLLAGFAFSLEAKPAKKGILQVPLSDGTTLNVRLSGDEHYHQYFTEDGYPLKEKDGDYYYCDFDSEGNLIDSGIKAVDVSARTSEAKTFVDVIDRKSLERRIRKRASKSPRKSIVNSSGIYRRISSVASSTDGPPFEKGYGQYPGHHFPAYGNQKAIVILVEYKDVKFDKSYDAKDYFTRMLNDDNFADYGGTGSAAQYFRENSNSAFIPRFDVYGPIQLANNRAYYGRNTWWGDDENPADMIKEACDALDATVDFREYDRDNDGLVDNIFVFYAGRGESSGGGADTVWPHSWNMEYAGYPDLYYDGVRISKYGCSNEWEISEVTNSGRPDGVGTFIHEFGHVIGLPDIYATYYTNSFTPGPWCVMDYGSYNNDGMTPPNYGAFERYALGWIKPREIVGALSATLQPIMDNACGIIRTSKPTEFFLLENRQQTGWDKYIPGHGMLIWHIDYDSEVWSDNGVNNDMFHQYVDVEEADGSESDYSRDGDAFPGAANVTSFTSSTIPALRMWSGEALDYPITEIVEDNGLITFNVLGGSDAVLTPIESHEAKDVAADTFLLSWESPDEGNDVILDVYTRRNGEIEYLDGFKGRNLGNETSCRVVGVNAETIYYFTVAQSNGWLVSSHSQERSVTTTKYTLNYFQVVAREASEITETSFTANWETLEGATEYYLSVFRKIQGDPYVEVNGFNDGISNLGDWQVSSNVTTYGMTTYAGEAAPSLRMPNGSSLTTPVFDDYIHRVAFWHRGNSTTDGDYIDIYALSAQGERLIKSVPVATQAGGVTVIIEEEIPENTVAVRIQFIRLGDKGYLALDDVSISHGYHYDVESIDAYDSLNVGDVNTYSVTGLNPCSLYFYTLVAGDGRYLSLPSSEVEVWTKSLSSVSSLATSSFGLTVRGSLVLAPTDEEIVATDVSGIVVARGRGKIRLPGTGFYLLTVPSRSYTMKTIIKL